MFVHVWKFAFIHKFHSKPFNHRAQKYSFTFVSEFDILRGWCDDEDVIVLTNTCLRTEEDGDIVTINNVECLPFSIRQQRHVSSQSQRRWSLLLPYSDDPVNSFNTIVIMIERYFYILPNNFTATKMIANARACSLFFITMVTCQLRPLSRSGNKNYQKPHSTGFSE